MIRGVAPGETRVFALTVHGVVLAASPSPAAREGAAAGRALDDDLLVKALGAADGLLVHGVDRSRLPGLFAPIENA